MNGDKFTPSQTNLIRRARLNGGLLPNRGYDMKTLGILRDSGYVRPGVFREDTANIEREITAKVKAAKALLQAGAWQEARDRLNEAHAIDLDTITRCYRLTRLGETCDLNTKTDQNTTKRTQNT